MSGQTCYCSDTSRIWPLKFKGRNCCDREPRLHSNPFITKKQLYPQAGFLGNKNYKLVVLPLFAFRTLQVFLVQRDHSS